MSDIAIRVDGLGKLYRLGATERYRTLRETLTDTFMAPFRRLGTGAGPCEDAETLWALKDVSFELAHGEVIGIIGRNGAGKSTLLKILSRITEPTEGYAEIHGRVGSLLEVGTGFHPELSGRENIFLNGAILGMKKAEVRGKFDEIVVFAEVEKFIDTPVKHYSSGMYMRLAFAVAAHMETDILIVDEVLAVGDLEFQKKCLGKMGDVSKGGRTVILVSHSMASITALCQSGIFLENGTISYRGAADATVDRYLEKMGTTESEWNRHRAKPQDVAHDVLVQNVRVSDPQGNPRVRFQSGEDVQVNVVCQVKTALSSLLCVIMIRTSSGIPVYHITQNFTAEELPAEGSLELTCRMLQCSLYPGKYVLSVWLGRNAHQEIEYISDALVVMVEQGTIPGVEFDLTWRHGLCHCDSEWSAKQVICVGE